MRIKMRLKYIQNNTQVYIQLTDKLYVTHTGDKKMIVKVNIQKKTVLVKGTIAPQTHAALRRLENVGYTVLVAI